MHQTTKNKFALRSGHRRNNVALQGVVGIVLVAALSVAGTSAANAAPLHRSTTRGRTETSATSDHSAHDGATTGGSTATSGSVGTSQKFMLYNDSAETLDFDHVDGNLPAPMNTPLLPGMSANFEMPTSIVHSYSGDVYYNVMNSAGQQVGTMKLALYEPWSGTGYFEPTFSTDSNYPLYMDNSTGQNMTVVDTAGSPQANQVYTPGSQQEQEAIGQLCQTDQVSCTFKSTGESIGWTQPVNLESEFNPPTAQSPIDLQVTRAVSISDTDTWGGAVTLGVKLFGLVDASVQANYSHAVSQSTTTTTGTDIPVQPNQTAYAWAQFPMYDDFGTWTAHLGNTTFVIPGVDYSSADPNIGVHYFAAYAEGNPQTIPQPDPSDEMPVTGPNPNITILSPKTAAGLPMTTFGKH
jgi:hypothetical protein